MSYGFTFKIITLGDAAVGKTATITRFAKNLFKDEYQLTIGVEFLIQNIEIDNEKVKLHIWDFLGQKRFQLLLPVYSKGANGAILLFDITRKVTFETLSDWIYTTRESAGDIPILLAGNKSDLEELREVSIEEAINFAKTRNLFGYIETSAKTGDNVGKAFFTLSRALITRFNNNDKSSSSPFHILKTKLGKQLVDKKIESKPVFSKEMFSKEQIELINLKIEEILTRPPKEGEFRFLIFGNEFSQKPLLSQLFRVDQIIWPPKTRSILYSTLNYTMKIDLQEYKFQLYFLSNIQKLQENSKLFIETCKVANGIIFFYNPNDQKEFKEVVDMCIELRKFSPKLEIILTAGSDDVSTPYHKLNQLEKKYQINNHDDYESLLTEILINTLKRKKKISKKIKYYQDETRKMQDQLSDQESDPEDFWKNIERLVQEHEEAISRENEAFSEKVSPSKNLIFISYSHKDSKWLERVKTHLKPLEREGNISRWDDTLIKAGEEWRKKISQSLKTSKVAILLISPNFLASDFIANNELPPLLEVAKMRGTTILSLIISPSRFEKIESLARLQTINNPESEPLVKLSEGEQDEVLVRLSNAVEEAFK